jgi:hypothetical protein
MKTIEINDIAYMYLYAHAKARSAFCGKKITIDDVITSLVDGENHDPVYDGEKAERAFNKALKEYKTVK